MLLLSVACLGFGGLYAILTECCAVAVCAAAGYHQLLAGTIFSCENGVRKAQEVAIGRGWISKKTARKSEKNSCEKV